MILSIASPNLPLMTHPRSHHTRTHCCRCRTPSVRSVVRLIIFIDLSPSGHKEARRKDIVSPRRTDATPHSTRLLVVVVYVGLKLDSGDRVLTATVKFLANIGEVILTLLYLACKLSHSIKNAL